MPNNGQAPSRSSRRHSTLDRWDQRISLVFFGLLTGFAVASVIGALFSLPANPPDRWWVTATARSMIPSAALLTLMCLVMLAVYLLVPEIRRFAIRFRSLRLARLAIAIALPSCIAILVYNVALVQDPALWNRIIFVLPLVISVASMVMLVIALFAGYRERMRLSDD